MGRKMAANVQLDLVHRGLTCRREQRFVVFAREQITLLVVAVASGSACALTAGRKNSCPNVAVRYSLINQIREFF